MTNVEDFGKRLFTVLADKLIPEENPDSSGEPDISERNFWPVTFETLNYPHPNDHISLSILMLSYVYRPAFTEQFLRVHPILIRTEGNPMIYIRCFAEASHRKYSSLKFLIVCSFISEIFVYLSKHLNSKKHSYVQQTVEALNDVYRSIFEKDFPQNGWTDIQNEASKIAKGFNFFEPFMGNEISHPNAIQVANAIVTNNYVIECEYPLIDENEREISKIVNVNIPSDTNSQELTQIPTTEIPLPDVLPTNQITNSDSNLMHLPEFSMSFGTVDQDPQLLNLLQVSGDQTEVVTFEDQPSRTKPSFSKVVETVEPSNRENLITKRSENEPELSRTVKLTQSGEREPCSADSQIVSEQKSMQDEAQFFECLADSLIISEQESIQGEAQFFECPADSQIVSEQESLECEAQFFECLAYSHIISEHESLQGEAQFFECPADSQIVSEQESMQSETQLCENDFSQISESKLGHSFLTVSENSENVSESQFESFNLRQSNAAPEQITTNEAVSSQQIDAQRTVEFEIIFPTEENTLSAKVFQINLEGNTIVVQVPEDVSLSFKYKSQTSSSKQPKT